MGTKTATWNWQKIDGVKNTPKFDKQVLLLEKRGEKCFASVGNLKSIDSKGCHWAWGMRTGSIFDIFNFNFESPVDEKDKEDKKEEFTPTHWCEIQIPED